MLETLDLFDWQAVGDHVYSQEERIPAEIRNLFSKKSFPRNRALGFLFGSQQDTGTIADTTPHIVKFVLEILADPATPARMLILDKLVWVLKDKVRHPTRSVRNARNYLATYNAIAAGIPLYLSLLYDRHPAVRKNSAVLLGCLSGHAAELLPKLVRCYAGEKLDSVKIALIEAVANILEEQEVGTNFRKQYGYFLV